MSVYEKLGLFLMSVYVTNAICSLRHKYYLLHKFPLCHKCDADVIRERREEREKMCT
jgi:hypothetical protein